MIETIHATFYVYTKPDLQDFQTMLAASSALREGVIEIYFHSCSAVLESHMNMFVVRGGMQVLWDE